jgi:fused signal recognition particle receptor
MIWGFGKKPTDTKDSGGLSRLVAGLAKSSALVGDSLTGRRRLDAEALGELEDNLIRTDMGARAAEKIIAGFSDSRFAKEADDAQVRAALAERIEAIMAPREVRLDFSGPPKPRVILVVGVNGSGKTTTVGKLCAKLAADGATVVVGAADTFRAAATEQLRVWTDRSGATLIAKPPGADAAGVAYETAEYAQKIAADVALIDTAGRLQNREELMSELNKIVRALKKFDEDAPHETLLVLDATVGQNALSQMESFRSAAPLTGLIMTKLDGTAKGGVLVAIAERHALPIHFIGIGESAEDLQPFSARDYARALAGVS